ncbi:MAG: CCA tRNA nucleotidyltransferase [Lachnospiraceae bacterium]|jgi:tRNA nucleotidyltransferase (CCA-adding enzyme)
MPNTENIIIDIPPDVRFVLDTIRTAGYEAYIVGGCVRDAILGRVPEDWDIATSALPHAVKSLFRSTVDTGVQHGTVMVLRGGKGYEVTTYRVDGQYKDGRHPESVEFVPSLEEDLKRRDFTVNAFAYSPERGIIDLFGGMNDLKEGVVRAVGDPRQRFEEDALRIMRAIRFAAQLSFKLEKKTEESIAEFASKLAMVSAERIRVEFEKTLFSANPNYVNEFAKLGLGPYIVYEFADRCFCKDKEALYGRTCGDIPAGAQLGIQHDTCPDTQLGTQPVMQQDAQSAAWTVTFTEQERRYLRLAVFFMGIKPEECRVLMRKMTFDNRSRDIVSGILENQDIPLASDIIQIKRQLNTLGPELLRLIAGFRQITGKAPASGNADTEPAQEISDVLDAISMVLEGGEAYSVSMLSISGADLIEIGVPQGPQVGKILEDILNKVIINPQLNKKDILMEFAGSMAAGLKV